MNLRRRLDERAQRRADEARQGSPTWFDMDRLPWWIFVWTGLYLLVMAANGLVHAQSRWGIAWALFGVAVVVPAQFLTAYRLRQRIPVMQPLLRRRS